MFKSVVLFLLAGLCWSQMSSRPWAKSEVVEPAALVPELKSAKPPFVLSTAFPALYRNRHIVGAVNAGPGVRPKGIALLKQAVAKLPKDADIVIYCGCCPMEHCPNLSPAYRALKEMGYEHVRVLNIPTNMHADWYSRNYPSEPGSAGQK